MKARKKISWESWNAKIASQTKEESLPEEPAGYEQLEEQVDYLVPFQAVRVIHTPLGRFQKIPC